MPLTYVTVDNPPKGTVEIAYLMVNDDCDYTRYMENTALLTDYIKHFDCYPMLESHDATLYVSLAADIDLDVMVIVMHCAVDSSQFTHYLLTRRDIANAWIYAREPDLDVMVVA